MLRDILGNDTTINAFSKKKKKKKKKKKHINDFEFLVILLHLELVDCENALYRDIFLE